MSQIFMTSGDPRHFLMDSKGDLYEVSEELAQQFAEARPSAAIVVDHVDPKTNTIWFKNPLPKEVTAE